MNDSKPDNRDIKKEISESNKKRLKILLLVSISFFIFIVIAAIFRDDGVIKVYHLNKKVELLKNNISKLKKENEKLNTLSAIKFLLELFFYFFLFSTNSNTTSLGFTSPKSSRAIFSI